MLSLPAGACTRATGGKQGDQINSGRSISTDPINLMARDEPYPCLTWAFFALLCSGSPIGRHWENERHSTGFYGQAQKSNIVGK